MSDLMAELFLRRSEVGGTISVQYKCLKINISVGAWISRNNVIITVQSFRFVRPKYYLKDYDSN